MADIRARPVEIRALAGARALPPLILVLFHFCEGHGYRGAKWFDFLAAKGYLWVEFFFALSGFVLTYVYFSRLQEFWRGGGAYLDFLKARLARLYPLHLAMLLLILVMMLSMRAIAASTSSSGCTSLRYTNSACAVASKTASSSQSGNESIPM